MNITETQERNYLEVSEYISFVGVILASTTIGLYFAYRDRKDATMKKYYYGGKDMNPVAVGLSLAVTFQSAVVVIAAPAETYISGTLMIWEPIVKTLVVPIALVYLIPRYHYLQLSTIYEFLGLRYNGKIRRVASALICLGMFFYVGAVIYMPAATLSAITPLPLFWSIILTGFICTFYTTLGGLKAVIWTDVLQCGIMTIGLLAIFIKGLYVIGGFQQLMEAVERGGRATAMRFDFGVISRLSPTGLTVGSTVMGMGNICFEQAFIQRYQACESVKAARWSLIVFVIPNLVIYLASFGTGLIMYAYYEGCDPVLSGKVGSIDQGVPYMALDIFKNLPGMTGLFMSAVFSASLSTISSVINSLSVLILEDFIVAKWPNMTERVKIIVGKSTVACLGAVLTATAFGIAAAKSNAFELIYGFNGLTYGPVIALYIMGFFMPWVTVVGAMTGVCVSFALVGFMFIGKIFFNDQPYTNNIPSVSVDMCGFNITTATYPNNHSTTTTPTMDAFPQFGYERSTLGDFYNINFSFLLFLSFVLTIVIGLVASFVAGHTPGSKANPKLFIPLIDNKIFSPEVRKFFRFGVPEIEEAKLELSESPKTKNGDYRQNC